MMPRRELIIEKSKLYVKGVVIRDPLTLGIVHSFASAAAAVRWARQNKWPLVDFLTGPDERAPETINVHNGAFYNTDPVT